MKIKSYEINEVRGTINRDTKNLRGKEYLLKIPGNDKNSEKVCWDIIVKDNISKGERGLLISKLKSLKKGIEEGHIYHLNLQGVGFGIREATIKNKEGLEKKGLSLNIGYSNRIEVEIPEGIETKIEGSEGNVTLVGKGKNKEELSLWMSKIKELKPSKKDKYKGKGFKFVTAKV